MNIGAGGMQRGQNVTAQSIDGTTFASLSPSGEIDIQAIDAVPNKSVMFVFNSADGAVQVQLGIDPGQILLGAPGVNADTSLKRVGIGQLQANGSVGMFGVVPPAAKPATPVTLADVIARLQAYGMVA